MTNPKKKKKKTEILELWTNLKNKLSKLVYLYQNKGLIKEAVEFHLLHASSFTSAHSDTYLYYWTKRKEELILRLEEGHFRGRAEAELLRDDLTRVKNVLSINNPRIQDFEAQKVKNERIVEKCKELLKELE